MIKLSLLNNNLFWNPALSGVLLLNDAVDQKVKSISAPKGCLSKSG